MRVIVGPYNYYNNLLDFHIATYKYHLLHRAGSVVEHNSGS